MSFLDERERFDTGDRKQYALERVPVTGGQAEVFRAEHKPTGATVAFKRLRTSDADSIGRMAREIELGRRVKHPNVMPILDSDPKNT